MTSSPYRCVSCTHGPAAHTGGHGECHYLDCPCARYADAFDVAQAMRRHPAGKALR